MTNKYPTPSKASSVIKSVMGAAAFGAIVGGTAAAAKGIRQVKAGEKTKEEVAENVAREAGATAVAVGTSAMVVGALGFGPFLATLGTVMVATGTKYAMDSVLKPAKTDLVPVMIPTGKAAAATPTAASKKTAAKKAPAKKAAAKKATTKKTAAKKITAAEAPVKKTTQKKTAAKKTETKTDTA